MSENDKDDSSKSPQGTPDGDQKDVEFVHWDDLSKEEKEQALDDMARTNDLPPLPDDVKERMEQDRETAPVVNEGKGKSGDKGR